MDDGSLKSTFILYVKGSSNLTKILTLVVVVCFILSFCYQNLLPILGALVVALVSSKNLDKTRNEQKLCAEIEKAKALNQFQSFLAETWNSLNGIRSNYPITIETGQWKGYFERGSLVPNIAYIPNFNEELFHRLVSKLSFTEALLSKSEAQNIKLDDPSLFKKSILLLSNVLFNVKYNLELWKYRNTLFDKLKSECEIVQLNGVGETFEVKTARQKAIYHDLLKVSEQCMVKLDEHLLWLEAAASKFVPNAMELISSEARDEIPILDLSNVIKSPPPEKLILSLNDDEQAKLKALIESNSKP